MGLTKRVFVIWQKKLGLRISYQFEIELIEKNQFKKLFQLIFLTNKLLGMSNLNREIKLVILWG